MIEIKKKIVPQDKYNLKCPYAMTPEFVVIHNTANDASAEDEVSYMTRNYKEVSYHYAVDEKGAIQGIEETRNAWHAGDGNGPGNRKGIAIEICWSESGGEKFVQAEKNAAQLAAGILKRYGWGDRQAHQASGLQRKILPSPHSGPGLETVCGNG